MSIPPDLHRLQLGLLDHIPQLRRSRVARKQLSRRRHRRRHRRRRRHRHSTRYTSSYGLQLSSATAQLGLNPVEELKI